MPLRPTLTEKELQAAEDYIMGLSPSMPIAYVYIRDLIAAYRAERKVSEKLAGYIADYHKGMTKSSGVDKPAFWLKWAREDNDAD